MNTCLKFRHKFHHDFLRFGRTSIWYSQMNRFLRIITLNFLEMPSRTNYFCSSNRNRIWGWRKNQACDSHAERLAGGGTCLRFVPWVRIPQPQSSAPSRTRIKRPVVRNGDLLWLLSKFSKLLQVSMSKISKLLCEFCKFFAGSFSAVSKPIFATK